MRYKVCIFLYYILRFRNKADIKTNDGLGSRKKETNSKNVTLQNYYREDRDNTYRVKSWLVHPSVRSSVRPDN